MPTLGLSDEPIAATMPTVGHSTAHSKADTSAEHAAAANHPTNNVANAKMEAVKAAARAAAGYVHPELDAMKTITVTVTKPSKATKLGLGVEQKEGHSGITVKELHEGSLFANSDLKVGCKIVSINGHRYASFEEGVELMKKAEGKLVIVAQMRNPSHGPSSAPPISAASITTANHHPIEPTTTITEKQADCLVKAARNWSKFGKQTPKFQVAACECFAKGFSPAEVARHIIQSEYADEEGTDKKLYTKIYDKVRYIKKSKWNKTESSKKTNDLDKENVKPGTLNKACSKDSMDKISDEAVAELLLSMGNIDLNKENENESSNKEEIADTADRPVLVDVLAQGLKNYTDKKERAQRRRKITASKPRAFVESSDSPVSPDDAAAAAAAAAAAGKRRARMIAEHPEQAQECILMGLRSFNERDIIFDREC